ncbi:MAG: exodeoxyribonuclease VII large subunit [Desulfosalsimonadaceae bacterium]
MATAAKKIYTVSELTKKIKALLEETYPFIWIQGEISNFKMPASGHYYFTLKDADAQISAVMFRGQNKKLRFFPEDGMSITGYGRVSVYSPRGAYQIILEYLEPSGAGALQAAFEQLKARLSEEGLFDAAYKKPLPLLPQKIALITSATGAVVHDMVRVMQRRYPNIRLEILPVSVQGDQAIPDIVSAINLLNRRNDADFAILARGGGSLEDLWAFNAEEVARAVFDSAVAIVSAVGHETDYTIADFVADLRAPTPSAAAEIVVPVKAELENRRAQLSRQLAAGAYRLIDDRRRRVRELTDRLVHPGRRMDDLRLRLDELSGRLQAALQRQIGMEKERLAWRTQRLHANSPAILLQTRRQHLDQLGERLCSAAKSVVRTRAMQAEALNARLNALNPAAVLQRGYSIARRQSDKTIIRDAAEVETGEILEILLARGRLTSCVKGRQEDGQEDL